MENYQKKHTAWNKNLTKKSDERLANAGIKISKKLKGKLSKTKGMHWKIQDTSKWKKTKNFLGHAHTEESKQKNREKHTGKKQTERTIQKRAKSRKLFFENGGVSGMKNKKHTEATKQKMRKPRSEKHKQKIREYQNKLETKQSQREWHIDHPNKKFSSTSIELKIREELEKRGFVKDIDYYCNVPLCKVANVDIYLPEYQIVIECDGCYYHNCSIHFPEHHKETRDADERKTRILTYNGFNVYRFWEHDINKSAEKCINQIEFQML